MTADEKFRSLLLMRCRALLRFEGVSPPKPLVSSFVWTVIKAAIGYCDELFFNVLASCVHEGREVPSVPEATKSLFITAKHGAPKADVAEAAVVLILADWQRSGSALFEAVGKTLVQQIRYDNHICRECPSQIAAGSKSPYCEHCDARDETETEEMEQEVIDDWEHLTPEERASAQADIDEATRDSDDDDISDEELENL